jgi:hypothetical protein
LNKFFDNFYNKNDFFDGLYNKKGKRHDLGANFGLTSDVYKKPNTFYTKNVIKNSQSSEKREPSYYPVYNPNNKNNSVTQEPSGEIYDSHLSTNFDVKTNTYSSYVPSTSYGMPSPSYGMPSPSSSYGPSSTYGTAGISYGSSSYYPSSSYTPHSSYGVSSSYSPSVTNAVQHNQKSHEQWFLAKLFKKFDLVLMSKLLLKLIIFKKIVKFIAIICLLLFLPTLKKKFEDVTSGESEEEQRNGKIFDPYGKCLTYIHLFVYCIIN